MLKLQFQASDKSVWLIGPVMQVGTARENDLILVGEGVAVHHCNLHVDDDDIVLEPLPNNPVYLNEQQLSGKARVTKGDTIRIGAQEFFVIDPRDKKASLPSQPEPESSQDTVFRTPDAAKASGWMLQGMHKSLRNKRYPVDGSMTLGRSQDCGLHFPYDRLSRKHAEFKVIDGLLFLKDLGSSNGTYHNGEKIDQARLHSGDTVAFDKLEFTVIAPAALKADDTSPQQSDNLDQTVVRSAITPEMIKAARSTKANADAAAAKMREPVSKADSGQGSSAAGILMIVAALVVVALVAFVFLI